MPPDQAIYGYDPDALSKDFERRCSTAASGGRRAMTMVRQGVVNYNTLPSRKPHLEPERSVTPDIMRGLGVQQLGTNSVDRKWTRRQFFEPPPLHQNVGIPVQMPQMQALRSQESPIRGASRHTDHSFRISPIDPRSSAVGFHASTPSKMPELKAAANLEHLLLSPKKSTMSTDELYAVIHKGKKKMNIEPADDRGSPNLSNSSLSPVSSESSLTSRAVKPETGYLDKSKSRLSWSPNNGEYMDFNTNIDQVPLESRSRQSWACSEKKEPQTSRLDFKKLLLQHGKTKLPAKKLSAVEQLKLSKQQIQPKPTSASAQEVSILDLSQSPRQMRNSRKHYQTPNSPEKPRPTAKILSPRSQWRFPNPRSDVLSSTILEDCHEDESPNSSGERKAAPQQPALTATQRLQAQRAQFFGQTPNTRIVPGGAQSDSKPTLETSF